MADERHVLRGAKVVDGTGAPARAADVVLQGDRIVDVTSPGAGAGTVVDLTGLVLSPGFIDCHTHYDAQILWDSDLTPSSWHGVTTVVTGNCGFTIAPTRPEHRDEIARTLANVEGMSVDALRAGIGWDFESFPQYMDAVERRGIRLNAAMMIGHTALRLFVLGAGATEREATTQEIAAMRALVAEALDAGAVGVASSRSASHAGAGGRPVPSRLAHLDEVREIGLPMRERGRGTFAITRGPDFDVEECGWLSTAIGRPVTYTMLPSGDDVEGALRRKSTAGGEVWPQISCRPIVMQVQLSEPAPFARVPAFTEILTVSGDERAERYRDASWRARARADVDLSGHPRFDRMRVQESEGNPELIGDRTIAEIARDLGVHPLDALCDIALRDDLLTRFELVIANADEAEIEWMLRMPDLLLGVSDAGAHVSQLCDAVFATYLLEHWVRDRGSLPLEQAIWRLTAHPAAVFGIVDRGVIRTGAFADLVAFDPDNVGVAPLERRWDLPAGADRLVAGSVGIAHIWINGEHVRRDGVDVPEARPGRVLRSIEQVG